jgi:hypothetical protein
MAINLTCRIVGLFIDTIAVQVGVLEHPMPIAAFDLTFKRRNQIPLHDRPSLLKAVV